MSEFTGYFADYVQNFQDKVLTSDTDTYRNLGRLDQFSGSDTLHDVQRRLLILIETWSLLKVEKPHTELIHLSPAGEYMEEESKEPSSSKAQNSHEDTFSESQRIRKTIKAIHQKESQYSFGKLANPNLQESSHCIYSLLTGISTDEVRLRSEEIWIGGSSQEDAKYIPPKASELANRLIEVENYITNYSMKNIDSDGDDDGNSNSNSDHAQNALDPLSLLCAAHSYSFLLLPYQRENMKWAVLWTHHLAQILQIPTNLFLPISSGIFSVRESYSEGLLQSLESDPTHWINIWKNIVSKSIKTSLWVKQRSETLLQSVESHRETFGKAQKHLEPLLLHLCSYPYVTLSDISDLTKLTKPNAALLIKKAETIGLLKQVTSEKRNRIYASPYIVDLCKKHV